MPAATRAPGQFRQSFVLAFGQRIHERLVMAAHQARETAERDLGRSLLPILAGRSEDVDEFTARLFPHLTKAKGSSVTNRDGWLAGRAAAEMATLDRSNRGWMAPPGERDGGRQIGRQKDLRPCHGRRCRPRLGGDTALHEGSAPGRWHACRTVAS